MSIQESTILLEIAKAVIIGGAIILGLSMVLKRYASTKMQLHAMSLQSKAGGKENIPMKLQAYERLLLFCERISVPNLIFRLRTQNMRSDELMHAMMIAIQQEYEHNLTQQLYVSDPLWQIVSLAKNEIQAMIAESMDKIDIAQATNITADQLIVYTSKWPKDPLETAKQAIKQEAHSLIKK